MELYTGYLKLLHLYRRSPVSLKYLQLFAWRYIVYARILRHKVWPNYIYILVLTQNSSKLSRMQIPRIVFLASLITATMAHTRVWSIWINGVDQGQGVSTYVSIH